MFELQGPRTSSVKRGRLGDNPTAEIPGEKFTGARLLISIWEWRWQVFPFHAGANAQWRCPRHQAHI